MENDFEKCVETLEYGLIIHWVAQQRTKYKIF